MKSVNTIKFSGLCTVLLFMITVFWNAVSQAESIPRILYVGDSWTGFMWGFRSMKTCLDLPEYNVLPEQFNRWVETGSSTAIMGAKAYEFVPTRSTTGAGRKSTIESELAKYPNIDIIVMTLGGNDYSGGLPVNIPGQGVRNVSWNDWYNENHDADPLNDWPESLFFNQLKADMREILRYILVVRPDIRISLVGYDYLCRNPWNDAYGQIVEQNRAIIKMEEAKRDLCLEAEFSGRVEYVQTFGVIQHYYGYFTTNEWGTTGVQPYPAALPLNTVDVQPGVVPLPSPRVGGVYPDWPSAVSPPTHQDPRLAYIDEDIHLQRQGYDYVAKHAIDTILREWLNYPKALSIIGLPKQGNTQDFVVKFTHPVSGVDVTDFAAFSLSQPAMSILDVQPGSGGDTYFVTVDLGGATDTARLKVLDDDSIVRTDNGVPLGGPGPGNGVFAYNGTYVFNDLLRPADDDFYGSLTYLDTVLRPYVADLMPGLSFAPDRFDANGALFLEGHLSEPYVIPGNSIQEAYEFALIGYMLKHPSLDLSSRGGLKAADVIAAWQNNITKMQATLGGPGSIGDILLPGLDTLLAGYMTIGDSDSTNLVSFLIIALNSIDNFPTQVGQLYPGQYVGFPRILSRIGPYPDYLPNDADGDGWSNEKEFAYFLPDGPDAYAQAALNPAIRPTTGAGMHAVGDSLRIAMFDHPAWDGTFQWYRNGQALSDGNGISGSKSRCLNIMPLNLGDAGNYTCVYQVAQNPGTGRVLVDQTYGPIPVSVGVSVPAAGLMGLALLTATLGIGGVLAARRKR